MYTKTGRNVWGGGVFNSYKMREQTVDLKKKLSFFFLPSFLLTTIMQSALPPPQPPPMRIRPLSLSASSRATQTYMCGGSLVVGWLVGLFDLFTICVTGQISFYNQKAKCSRPTCTTKVFRLH